MDNKNYQNYQSSLRTLLNQALVEGLKRNEAQSKTWKDYRKAHEKVKKGLEILPQELTTNCMVPIGRKALMKGKLVHTNEILVCLGEGYFAKYSARQAIAVCDRRIKQADEMLINLEKEQNLLEMRQSLPIDYGIFANEEQKEIIETYNEEEEEQWRIKHREREKEYRQQLAKLQGQKKTRIQSEEDLWQRLDELELLEELEDEIDRLQADDCNYYGEDTQDNDDDSYEEEDCEFSEDEMTDDIIKERLVKLKNSNVSKHQKDLFEKENLDKESDHDSSSTYSIPNPHQPSSSSSSAVTVFETESSGGTIDEVKLKSTNNQEISHLSSETSVTTSEGGSTDVKTTDSFESSSSRSESEIGNPVRIESQSFGNTEKLSSSSIAKTGELFSCENNDTDNHKITKSKKQKRRVSFTDKIQVNVFDDALRRERESSSESDVEDEIEKLKIIEDMISVGVDFSSNDEQTEDSTENADDSDDIIRIEVKHSDVRPRISDRLSGDNTIEDPSDVYRIFCKPKSILKKSPSDVNHSQNIIPPADDVFDQETNELPFGSSYTIIVKDVEERNPEVLEINTSSSKKRPPSRFKMARSGIKQ